MILQTVDVESRVRMEEVVAQRVGAALVPNVLLGGRRSATFWHFSWDLEQ